MSFLSSSSKTKMIDQGGFSLVEAMVAIVIFGIGILGAYKMQLHAVHSNALANRVSAATTWAGYAIEEIIGKPYSDLNDINLQGVEGIDAVKTSEADGYVFIDPDGSTQTSADGDEIYSIYWNIVEGDPTDTSNTTKRNTVLKDIKQIRVHVIREGGIGNGHLYSHDFFKVLYPEK